MKIISIIIATYNAGSTIARCLSSIVPQLSDSSELIIIDGGSNDDTMSIITRYTLHIAYSISEPDKGIYDAWNKGIKVAQGKWVMFIGADDILLPNALSVYLDAIRRTNDIDLYDYVCAHNRFVDKQGRLLKIIGEKPEWKKMRRTMCAAHVASLHNKQNLFESIGEYNLEFKICADYELLLRKKNKLKSLMLDAEIAQMQVGGMSFSVKAIKETKIIRALHHSVPPFVNTLLYCRDYFVYKFFVFRKTLLGKTLI